MPPTGPLPPAGSDPTRATPQARRVVGEKLRILRLLRALDRAGVSPEHHRRLRTALVDLAEVDQLLSMLLELLDRDPGSAPQSDHTISELLPACESVRGSVIDALPPREQSAVRHAASAVVATEAEIWLEVEGVRRAAAAERARAPTRGPRPPRPPDRAKAERALARGTLPPAPGAADVAKHERLSLPAPDAPLVDWLASLPPHWLLASARLHDLPIPPAPSTLPTLLASRLQDPAWLATYLAQRLGASEREVLAAILALGEAPMAHGAKSMREALEVHWAWDLGIPATSGGRLRAAGLVYVGRRGNETVAAIPSALRKLLAAALEAADPAAAGLPARAARSALATATLQLPHADPTLARWKAHDSAISKRLEKWALASPPDERALQALFGDDPRVVEADTDVIQILEYMLLDWRPAPDAPSEAERMLSQQPFKDRKRHALAHAILAAPIALYRAASVRRGQDLTLAPLFPPGDAQLVTDRAASLTVEVGWLCGARLYPAGPFTFCRWLGNPLPREAERRVLNHLRRAHKEHAAASGPCSEATFLRAKPEAIARALRACAKPG